MKECSQNSVFASKYLDHPIFGIVSDVAESTGLRAFVIGGYVRDCFLGKKSKDIDIVVEGSGTAFAREVGKRVHSRVSVFENYGTAMLRYHHTEIEFVGARRESYTRDSRNPIVEDGTLEDDQLRRDFTINAMAFSLQKEDYGTLVDPFGGIRDLDKGIIRTPADPDKTFDDDPLRMLRAVRFATKLSTWEKYFNITPECFASIRRNASRLQILSKERIVEELNKILVTDHPSMGFDLMDRAGMLQYILPDLLKLKGVQMLEGRAHKENFAHTLQVVDNLAEMEVEAISQGLLHDYEPVENGFEETLRTEPNVWLRWAALLHDIGKPASKKFDPVTGWSFHGHEVIGGRMVPKIFTALKMPLNEKMKYVQKLVSLHLRPQALVTEEVTDSAVRRLLFEAGNDIEDLMLLCKADITSKNEHKVEVLKSNFDLVMGKIRQVEEKDAIRNWKNPITGDYIMELYGLPPCRILGELKDAIKEAIMDSECDNTFEAADALLRRLASERGLVPADRRK